MVPKKAKNARSRPRLAGLAVLSKRGSFGGLDVVPAPADSLVAALLFSVGWWFGRRSGTAWQNTTTPADQVDNPAERWGRGLAAAVHSVA